MVNIGFFFNKKKDEAYFILLKKGLLHTEILNWTLFWKIWKFDPIFNASIMCKNVPEAKGNEICYGKSGMVLMCILNFHQRFLIIFFFSISGIIKNTVPLNYSVSHNYILSVVAFDCGQKRSEPLLVNIEVKKACSTGWTGKSRL